MSLVWGSGTTLEGRYVLEEPLGRGGMGTVWRAEHTALGTRVAVKLMDPGIARSPEMLARFRREARVAAALDSPNVVRILDFGVEQGTPYIVMELLEGETLGARLARVGALPRADAVRIAGQIARGVACAHAAQIVHRDLKPENVFLARIDGEEVAKVLDFGVAKVTSDGQMDPLTRTGAVLGTLQYMSPEQLEGRRDIDGRSDLWAFGIIVFECVCGRPPFSAESIAELVRMVCLAPMPVPSRVAPVPASFDAWFARATQREPAGRFESARSMADALAAALPIEAGQSPPSGRSSMVPGPASTTASAQTEAAPLLVRRGGSERAGFELAADPRARLLSLRFWGFWDLAEAQAFRSEVLRAYDELAGAPWVALSRSQNYPPQKPEVQAVHNEVMGVAAQRGLRRVAVVVNSALSQMQIRRLFEESGNPNVSFFQDEGAARAWLSAAPLEPKMG